MDGTGTAEADRMRHTDAGVFDNRPPETLTVTLLPSAVAPLSRKAPPSP
jgi:hypothetical protein